MVDNSRRMGSGMMVAGWILILICLTWFFALRETQQTNPNTDPETYFNPDNHAREVVLLRNRNHHYIVSGTINGIANTFILDTGATDVVVPAHVAKKAKLPWGHQQYAATAGGAINTYATRIQELTIGNIKLHNIIASINPHMDIQHTLLGMSALKHIDFVQSGDTLTLRQY